MTQAAKAAEPSMEEILASIRRIIADDEPAKPAAAPDVPPPRPVAAVVPAPEPVLPPPMPPVAEAPAPEPPLLVGTFLHPGGGLAPPAEPAVGFRTINGESDLTFED